MAAYDKAHELARDLKLSDEYKGYQRAKQDLLGNEAALSILKEYQRKRLEFEMEVLSGKAPDSAAKQELDKITELVSMHGQVKRFLEAEARVMLMMADIQRIITEALDLMDYR